MTERRIQHFDRGEATAGGSARSFAI